LLYNMIGMERLSPQYSASVVLRVIAIAQLVSGTMLSATCLADTFTRRQSGNVLHGYKTSKVEGAETFVQTTEKGLVRLNLAEWQIVADRNGRGNKVVVMELTGPIMYEIETQAFENAIVRIADEGPLFILLEIDTPGGRVDLAHRICGAITAADNVQVTAYIKGGQTGGALSAGAAVALAADKIYMAQGSCLGAATMVTGEAETLKQALGEDVGEKYDSAWRARLASLAEQNERPGILARAMVDKDIEVVEVNEGGGRLFIDPVNRKPQQNLIKTWSKKGSLLTLTAAEAIACGFAESTVSSREELLRKEGAARAEVVINDDIQRAGEELKRAQGQVARIRKSVDLEVKKAESGMYLPEALKLLRNARAEFKTLLNLARKYPDLGLDVRALEDELNSIEAAYRNMKRQSRRH
jgi:membrane-bound ClpP family serine protease